MGQVRKNLEAHLKRIGMSQAKLSRQLGFGPSYINDYITKNSPKELGPMIALQISEITRMPLSELGLDDGHLRLLHTRALDPRALADDVERFVPPRGSLLTPRPGLTLYRLKSDVLALHPVRMRIGDVLGFDETEAAIETLRSEAIVLLQLELPGPGAPTRLLLREFVRPSLVTTNRRRDNEAFCLEDPALPSRPRIAGVLRNIERDVAA